MNRRSRRALERRIKALDDAAAARFRDFLEAQRPGRRIITTELLGNMEAVAHPDLGPHVMAALLAAFGAAQGIEAGAMRECFACEAGWTMARIPAATVLIRTTKPDAVMLSFGYCWRNHYKATNATYTLHYG